MRLTLRSALAILLVLLLASFALVRISPSGGVAWASTTATRSLYLPWAIRSSKSE